MDWYVVLSGHRKGCDHAVQAWGYLKRLSELPARGSATEGERQAAQWLRGELQTLGYDVTMQTFSSPRHTLYVGPVAVIVAILVAMGLSGRWPGLATALAGASLIPLIGEMLGSQVNFDLILPKRPSQNVVARPRVAKQDARPSRAAKTDVVIVAHYDAQWGSWLFAPWFRPFIRPFFVATYAGLVLGLVSIGLRWVFPSANWTQIIMTIAGVILAAAASFLIGACWTGRTVPGANDNGSGVAVALALAARWQAQASDFVPAFVFTGCEEVGLRGMQHFVATAEQDTTVMFVNLDNVGGGRLRYLLGEGMLTYTQYDPDMIAVAETVAERYGNEVRPLKNLLLPTDGLITAKAGHPTITFLAARDDHSIPHYHWHTDTLDNADPRVIELTEAFVWDYLNALHTSCSQLV